MSAYRVFVTCDIGSQALDRLREKGYQVELYSGLEPPPREIIRERVSSGIHALVTTLRDRIDSEILEAGQGTLKVISQDAVGIDNIDREAANRLQIPFTNTPEVLTDATAEFAMFMMGSVARRLYSSERLVRDCKWTTWHPSEPFLGDEVSGKTVGVVGAGRIGRAFIQKCSGLRVDLLCFTRSTDQDFADSIQKIFDLHFEAGFHRRRRRFHYVDLEQCLSGSDFVSLHVPLTVETHHLIDGERLNWMKETSYLINTSRGAIVDEAALVRALTERRIAGAALDVFEKEPLPANSPLRAVELQDRLRLFHHFGSGARLTRLSPDPDVGMAGRCVQGVIDVLENNYGGDLTAMPFVVNKEAF